jgi:hypothetical protein
VQATKKLTLAVMNSIKVLAKVEEASAVHLLLAPEVFYNQLISDKMDMQDHYLAWRQSQNNDHRSPAGMGPFSFCSFPFLLNAKAKTRLLQVRVVTCSFQICSSPHSKMARVAAQYGEELCACSTMQLRVHSPQCRQGSVLSTCSVRDAMSMAA